MAKIKKLSQLKNKINKIVEDALHSEDDVYDAVVRVGSKRVDEDVYSYKPKEYVRTHQLREKWGKDNVNQGISVHNTRKEGKKNIAQVVETGEGYDYTGYGYDYEKPRPFIKNTKNEIADSKVHVKALKASLKRKGFRVK